MHRQHEWRGWGRKASQLAGTELSDEKHGRGALQLTKAEITEKPLNRSRQEVTIAIKLIPAFVFFMFLLELSQKTFLKLIQMPLPPPILQNPK